MQPTSFLIFDLGPIASNRLTVIAVGDGWEPIMDEEGRWIYTALNLSMNVSERRLRTSYFFKTERHPSLGMPVSLRSLPLELQRYILLQFHHHSMKLLSSMENLYNKDLAFEEKRKIAMGF